MFLGIDGGGTYTRVALCNPSGKLLAYTEYRGGASIKKDPQANENVAAAIKIVMQEAVAKLSQVSGLAIGVADFNGVLDLDWAQKLTSLNGKPPR